MQINIFEGILIPFVGTTLGAACVFFMRKTLSKLLQRALAGFAAGIMVAASIWSLLIPAIKQSENMGTLSFVPAAVGFWIGIYKMPIKHQKIFLQRKVGFLHRVRRRKS